jgi:hypothetical protein
MPLMPEYFLSSIAFIYPTEEDAKVDVGFMGVGFMVGMPSPDHQGFKMCYLVTAYHVIKDSTAVTLRFNLKSGGMRFVKDWPLDHWVANPSLDIALTPVHGDGLDFAFLPRKIFVDAEKMKAHKIGAGDEVCLIGRVMREKVRYVTRNIAMLRFGNISLIPQHQEKMFLVELRSISGHSGSPVVVYCPPYSLAGTREDSQRWGGYLLLGVNRGHLPEYQQIVSAKNQRIKSENWVSETNVAISQIVPAWHIEALLDWPALVEHRVRAHAELKRRLTTFEENDAAPTRAAKRRSVARKSKRAR